MNPLDYVARVFRGRDNAAQGHSRLPPSAGQGLTPADARGWLYNIFAHDYAERLEIDRASLAESLGQSAGERVSRFAGQTINHTGGGFVKGALAAAAVGGLTALGVAGWPLLVSAIGLNAVSQTVQTQKETVIEPEVFDIDIEAKDGRLVPTGVRKVDE